MSLTRQETLQILLVAYMPMFFAAQYGLPSSITLFFVAHPLELLIGMFSLPILALIFIDPDSLLRLFVIPFITAGVVAYHRTAHIFMPDRAAAGGLSGPCILLYLAAINSLLLQRLYLASDGRERSSIADRKSDVKPEWSGRDGRSPTQELGSWTVLGWASRVIISYRAIGSPREAKNVPHFDSKDPAYVPSRAQFLLERGLAVLGAFVVVDFLNHQPPPPADLFAASKSYLFPALSTVTASSIATRLFSTVLFWFGLRMTIGLIYNFASVVGVATFLTTPADWPPYFGSISNAYTLRKFWAVFWHSGLRNPLVGTAEFFTYDVLRLQRRTLAARYVNIVITFYISGTMHVLLDVLSGIPVSETNARTLFLMQAVGIIIEDFVKWAYHTTSLHTTKLGRTFTANEERTEGKGGVKKPVTLYMILGYVWVLAFLFWTTPSWSYANFRHDGDQLLPVSLVEKLQAMRA